MKPCKYGCTDRSTEVDCPDHGDVKGLRAIMPSGDGCYYVDADHSYWRMRPDNGNRGTRLTGVTTITKTLDIDPSHLLKWAARTNGIGIAMLAAPVIDALMQGDGSHAPDELSWLRSADTIWERLEAEQLTYDDVRDAKGVIGTNVHERAFQALALGKPVPDLDQLTDTERGYAQGVMACWLDHEPEATHVEQIVLSTSLGVAGRVDFLGKLTTRCGAEGCPCADVDLSKQGVLDAKTGNYIGASAHAQVHGYGVLAEESGFGDTDWHLLLHLRPDGSYKLVRAHGDADVFRDAVKVYRAAGSIDREAGKDRKARA